MLVCPNESPSAVIGVDVGATKILVGSVGQDGIIFRQHRYPMEPQTRESTLLSIYAALEDFLRAADDGLAPSAIGVGLVGHTDPTNGIWQHSINLSLDAPVPLAAQLEARFHLPTAIDNDVHAATLAEIKLGVGRETRDFIHINVGTGIAAGLVCDGQLVRGAANYAGELGHMVVEPNGVPCPCGRLGCLETIASGGGLVASVEAQLSEYPDSLLRAPAKAHQLSAHTIFWAADSGDGLANSVVERAIRGLEIALVNLVNLLNPARIIFGGGVVSDGWLVERLRRCTGSALPPARDALRAITLSQLQADQVGLLGAASLAWARQSNRTLSNE